MSAGLNTTLDQILWVLNAYILVYAVLLITAGRSAISTDSERSSPSVFSSSLWRRPFAAFPRTSASSSPPASSRASAVRF